MLHLRFHRRTPSNPTSPTHDRTPWDPTALSPAQLAPSDGVPPSDNQPRSPTSVPFTQSHSQAPSQFQRDQNPPVLPPIAKVVSDDSTYSTQSQNAGRKSFDDSKPPALSPTSQQSGFMGGLTFENYRRGQAVINQLTPQRESPIAPPPLASAPSSTSVASAPVLTSGGKSSTPALSARTASSFVSPTDLQNAPPMGKRPPGTRIASEPSMTTNSPVTRDQPKAKKALPFLKNPMSTLLLRRKTSQNIPDPSLSALKKSDEPTYDPRIRGTRVHDFSAPRARKPIVQPSSVGTESTNPGDGPVSHPQHNAPAMPVRAPPVPPKDGRAELTHVPSSSSHSKGHPKYKSSVAEEEIQRQDSSTIVSTASMSRKVSAASVKSSFSAIPRHMKSTSSRFSFDMIGAAEQEKLLEERHRQRQQDKASGLPTDRDSRFDEFDEDAFDYDAMDYDDGLEERIPGVNADFDDYEEDFDAANDPDNDQENFAGFSFQRSEPTPSFASPPSAGYLPTSSDISDPMAGYAQTGETSGEEQYSGSSADSVAQTTPGQTHEGLSAAGLGIQGLEPVVESPGLTAPPVAGSQCQGKPHLDKNDELYFDGGHEFDGEGDGSTFDESIFDLNDTDQYGRPIPSMFANALAQRNAALETQKRESDITSGISAQSALSQSTAHTSVSAGAHPKAVDLENEVDASHDSLPPPAQQTLSIVDESTMAAYQAALAAAANEAAASGKFRRASPPNARSDLVNDPPPVSAASHSQPVAIEEDELADYERDDEFSAGLDDYELDDDAYVAEANADALANDYDGWYGQEFGFYSAPITQSSHAQNLQGGKIPYQYSNGGYFGPSGIDRTASGRVVSREPNLTPITERSEYSNRNSLMSIGWPQVPNNGGSILSPGLAQLAMMAEDHDMSLSALLKVRNKAWGGSQVSLASSRDGSPYDRNGATSPLNHELGGVGFVRGRKNSAFSIYSQDSAGARSESGSPTLTMAIPNAPTSSIPPLSMSLGRAASPASAPVLSPLVGRTTFSPVSEVNEPNSPASAHKSPQIMEGSTMPTIDAASKERPSPDHKHKGSTGSV